MPMKVVSVNEEVQARRPNTCQWRAARVLEDANQNNNRFVKLKFIGDTTVHTIPWAHIKLFQYVKRDSLFRSSVPSRSLTRASRKVISIDLTDSEDLEEAEAQRSISVRVEATSPQAEREKDQIACAAQVDYSSSVTSDHRTKAKSAKSKPLSTNPCTVSNSDLNGHLSVSDHDAAERYASPPDDVDTPQTSRESVSARTGNNSEKKSSSSVANRLEPPSKHVSGLNSVRRLTRSFALQTEPVPLKKARNKEIIWDTRPPCWEDELRKDLERVTILNGNIGSPLRRRSVSGKRTVSIPRERHPQQVVEDIPIPRAGPQYNDSSSIFEPDSGGNEDIFNLATGLTPSKRPRSSSDFLYKNTMMKDTFSKSPSNGLRHRMRKKARRFRDSHGRSTDSAQHSTERLREVISESETNILERFKSAARFPFASEDDGVDGDVDKLVMNECDEMADEHKNEVQAMLQSFGELKIKKTLLTARNQGSRKKSKPKRWADRKITEGTIFQQGAEDLFPKTKEDVGVVEDIPSELFNSSVQDGGSANHEIRCGCQSPKSSGRDVRAGRALLQCGLCGYWSHLECVALDEEFATHLRGANSVTNKHFICTFCVDDVTNRSLNCVTAQALRRSPRLERAKGSGLAVARARSDSGATREWHSHVSPVVPTWRQTKRYNSRSSRKLLKSTTASSRSRYRPRPPLSEAEIQARNKNVEFLRSGVLKPSIGLKERELIDGKTPNFSM